MIRAHCDFSTDLVEIPLHSVSRRVPGVVMCVCCNHGYMHACTVLHEIEHSNNVYGTSNRLCKATGSYTGASFTESRCWCVHAYLYVHTVSYMLPYPWSCRYVTWLLQSLIHFFIRHLSDWFGLYLLHLVRMPHQAFPCPSHGWCSVRLYGMFVYIAHSWGLVMAL